MGAQRWMIVACLAMGLMVLMETVSGETVPCIDTQAECLATGFSSIAILNNNYRCCPPGFSMSATNSRCSCVRTSEAVNCSKGPKACRNAVSISSDGQGNTECCPLGFNMHAQMISVYGRTYRSCTCTSTTSGAGGSFQVIGGDGQMISFTGGGGGSSGINTTELGRQFQTWRHHFQSSMSRAMGHLANSMLAMNRHLQGMGSYMTSLFNTVFRG